MDSLTVDDEHVLQTREEFAVRKLREAILRGYLKPGDRLDQIQIADQLQISRSPVRDALRTLAAEGLVEVFPHRGAIVAELAADELEEIFVIRSVLEGMSARLAAGRLEAERIAELGMILAELETEVGLDRWLELNRRFHHTLYRAANRPRLFSMVENLRNTTAPYVREYIASGEHITTGQASHRRILQACIDGDGAKAEAETRKHMETVGSGVLEFFRSGLTPPLAADKVTAEVASPA